jgi:hypothetical protein
LLVPRAILSNLFGKHNLDDTVKSTVIFDKKEDNSNLMNSTLFGRYELAEFDAVIRTRNGDTIVTHPRSVKVNVNRRARTERLSWKVQLANPSSWDCV